MSLRISNSSTPPNIRLENKHVKKENSDFLKVFRIFGKKIYQYFPHCTDIYSLGQTNRAMQLLLNPEALRLATKLDIDRTYSDPKKAWKYLNKHIITRIAAERRIIQNPRIEEKVSDFQKTFGNLIDLNNNRWRELLIEALDNDDVPVVRTVLENMAKPLPAMLLHSAIDKKRLEILKLFIKYGAEINELNPMHQTPLLYAAWELCDLLKNNNNDYNGVEALQNIALYLIKKNADTNMQDAYFGPIHLMIMSYYHFKRDDFFLRQQSISRHFKIIKAIDKKEPGLNLISNGHRETAHFYIQRFADKPETTLLENALKSLESKEKRTPDQISEFKESKRD